MAWPISIAFLLSGFAGLMHEIVWSKLLAGLIGTTAHAQAAVLVVYMGGLALGSMVFGKQSDRRGKSLRTYMVLEFLIAAYCLILPGILAVAGQGYVWVAGRIFEYSQLKFGLRFGVAMLTVLLPAVLMGGTLPLLGRHIIGEPHQTRRLVAGLYSLNNFGAVLGAAVAGFVTLPLLGVYPSLFLASGMNVVAGVLVWPLVRRAGAPSPPAAVSSATEPPVEYPSSAYGLTLLALAVSGFAAMGYEIVFIRVIALAFGATTYSFTVMLMCFITGIGLGSAVMTRWQPARPLWLLGVTQLVAAMAFLASTPLMERLPYFVGLVRIAALEAGGSFLYYQLGKAFLCLAVLLVPTMCVGASFPLVAAIQARQASGIGSAIGSTYACNTLGNVLGVLVTSLVLLPTIGLLGSFHLNIALSVLAGLLVLAVAAEVSLSARVMPVLGVGIALVLYVSVGLTWTTPLVFGFNHLSLTTGPPDGVDAAVVARHPASSFAAWKRAFILGGQNDQAGFLLEEESHANVVAGKVLGAERLVVNTKTDASTDGGDLETQLLLAHAPLFMKPDARSILVIGYGSGITLGSAMRHPLERADVVEISDGVLSVDPVFAPHNYGVLSDPRVRVYIDDAQSFLQTVPRRYDVIVSEPSNPWISGIAGLFTVEFFEIARQKLEPGGVFALWFHEYEQSDDAIRLILRTFRSVFPHVSLFAEQQYRDIIAIGTVEAAGIDPSALEKLFDRPAVRNDLSRIGISNLASLLSHLAVRSNAVEAIAGDGPVNSVTRQQLEYSAIRAMFLGASSGLVELASPLPRGDPGAFVDGYIGYRESVGEPVRRQELEAAAFHMSSRGSYALEHRRALMARAAQAPVGGPAATSPARGATPEPSTAGYYESVYWARRLRGSGDSAGAEAFAQRAASLQGESR